MARRTLILLVAVLIAFAVHMEAAKADIAAGWYFVLGQVLSDVRQKPVERQSIGLNPTYNVYTDIGDFVGANPDARVIVAAVKKGAKVVVDPGIIAKINISGYELESQQPGVQKVATLKKPWLLTIDTASLPQGLYPVVIRVFYREKRSGGFLNLGRYNVTRKEETLIRFIVLDPEYMAKAVNSVEIQDYLRASFGLVGGPTQIGQLKFDVRPEVTAELEKPIQPLKPVASTPSPTPLSPVPEVSIQSTPGVGKTEPAELKPVPAPVLLEPRGKIIIHLWDQKGFPTSGWILLKTSDGDQKIKIEGKTEINLKPGKVEIWVEVLSGFSKENPGWVIGKDQKDVFEIKTGEEVKRDFYKLARGGENK